jgi:predicted HTH domain antitoxin
MRVVIDLPAEVERRIRSSNADVAAYAREVLAVQLFRDGSLTHYELGRTLGLDRFATDALLKRYRVEEHALTHDDVDADVESINSLLGVRQ